MLRLTAKISIQHFEEKSDGSLEKGDKYNLDWIQDVKVQSSWETMMDTASIVLPKNQFVRINETSKSISWAKRNIVFQDKSSLSENPTKSIFTVRDCVKIELGYDNKLQTVFTGVVTFISEEAPISLVCSDALWLLKYVTIEEMMFSAGVTLSEVLSQLQSKLESNEGVKNLNDFLGKKLMIKSSLKNELVLSGFSIRNQSAFQILEELKNAYELDIFYRDHVIYVGEMYPEELDSVKKVIRFGKQFNIISDSLVGVKKNDASLRVIVTGIPSKGLLADKKVVEIGKGDSKIYLEKFDVLDEASLKAIGSRRLSKLQYEGYKGSFLAFGTPFVQHGDKINLRDQYLVAKEGVYRVKSVEYSFGNAGYRQRVELHELVK
jgi:hypothetical protein